MSGVLAGATVRPSPAIHATTRVPQVAKEFFEYREAQKTGIDPKAADKANKAYPV